MLCRVAWLQNLRVCLAFQVSRDKHHYTQDIESREEGGTPAIIESIRAGLVFQLKNVSKWLENYAAFQLLVIYYLMLFEISK